jgi:hypothetical protein
MEARAIGVTHPHAVCCCHVWLRLRPNLSASLQDSLRSSLPLRFLQPYRVSMSFGYFHLAGLRQLALRGGSVDIANAAAGAVAALANAPMRSPPEVLAKARMSPPHPRYDRRMMTSSLPQGVRFEGEPGSHAEIAFYRRLRRAGRI